MYITEQAEKVWTNHNGIICAIVHVQSELSTSMANLLPDLTFANGWKCGYVKLPLEFFEEHKGKDYNDLPFCNIEIHGGITYGPDEDGFVGFDDAHGFRLERPIEEEIEDLALKIYNLAS